MILKTVTDYRLEFSHPPQLQKFPFGCNMTKFSQTEQLVIESEIIKLRQKGVSQRLPHTIGEFISPFFVRPKPAKLTKPKIEEVLEK